LPSSSWCSSSFSFRILSIRIPRTELEMDGGEVAKLRIRKEKDFNITEFYLISFVFYGIRLAVSSEFIIFALYL
jgi:hypothetical protein